MILNSRGRTSHAPVHAIVIDCFQYNATRFCLVSLDFRGKSGKRTTCVSEHLPTNGMEFIENWASHHHLLRIRMECKLTIGRAPHLVVVDRCAATRERLRYVCSSTSKSILHLRGPLRQRVKRPPQPFAASCGRRASGTLVKKASPVAPGGMRLIFEQQSLCSVPLKHLQ